MGKKKHSSGHVSKGERRSSMSTKNRDPGQRLLNQMDALEKGKNVVFTVKNPNKEETNRQFIKVKVDGRQWLKRREGTKPSGGNSND